MLEIRNLHARIAEDGTEIIRGLNLTVKAGEVAAIMGPNGSGKSTLSYILSGRERPMKSPPVTSSITAKAFWNWMPSERAAKGIFLAFQYPVEIPGCCHHAVPQGCYERAAQGARRGRADDAGLSSVASRKLPAI